MKNELRHINIAIALRRNRGGDGHNLHGTDKAARQEGQAKRLPRLCPRRPFARVLGNPRVRKIFRLAASTVLLGGDFRSFSLWLRGNPEKGQGGNRKQG